MKTVTLDLNNWEARFLLEACRTLQTQWAEVARTTEDEDVEADYSNDLAQLGLVRKRLEQAAVETFGPEILNFSRAPIS